MPNVDMDVKKSKSVPWFIVVTIVAFLVLGTLSILTTKPSGNNSKLVEPTRTQPLVREIEASSSISGEATVIGEPVPIPNTNLLVVRLQQNDPAAVGQETTLGAIVSDDRKPKPGDRVHWRGVTWYNNVANASDFVRVIDGPAHP